MTEKFLNSKRIDKDIPVPYYYQIVQVMRESIADIDDGEINEEIALPSESELGELFSVNRGTIRHALDVLEREGLIFRKKGRGTFVHRRRIKLDLSFLRSTTEDLKNRGWKPTTEVIGINQTSPRSHIRTALNLREEEMVWEVYRRRLANEEPISLQRSFLPVTLMPDLIKNNLEGSLYKIWQDVYKLQPKTGEQKIRTRAATEEEAKNLEIQAGDPIFEITRTTVDINGHPIEYLISLWRGDRYDFHVHLNM